MNTAKQVDALVTELKTAGKSKAEIAWLRALSVSGVAFVLSILTSLAGLPEVPSIEKKPPADDEN